MGIYFLSNLMWVFPWAFFPRPILQSLGRNTVTVFITKTDAAKPSLTCLNFLKKECELQLLKSWLTTVIIRPVAISQLQGNTFTTFCDESFQASPLLTPKFFPLVIRQKIVIGLKMLSSPL